MVLECLRDGFYSQVLAALTAQREKINNKLMVMFWLASSISLLFSLYCDLTCVIFFLSQNNLYHCPVLNYAPLYCLMLLYVALC